MKISLAATHLEYFFDGIERSVEEGQGFTTFTCTFMAEVSPFDDLQSGIILLVFATK